MTMDTSEKREPLMSDAEACSLRSDIDSVALRVRDFYEAKIASGELRVVKEIPRDQVKEHVLFKCADNMMDAMDTYFHTYIDFCPGCGAKITD